MKKKENLVESEAVPETGLTQMARLGKKANTFNVAQGGRDLEAAPVASGVCHDESEAAPVASGVCHDEADIPEEDDLPVASFKDDVQRKLSLRKVMPHKDDEEKPEPNVVQSVIVGEGGPGSGRRPEGGAKQDPAKSIFAHGYKPSNPSSDAPDEMNFRMGNHSLVIRGDDSWEHYAPSDQKAPSGATMLDMIGSGPSPDSLPAHLDKIHAPKSGSSFVPGSRYARRMDKGMPRHVPQPLPKTSEAYDDADLPSDDLDSDPDTIDGDNNEQGKPVPGNDYTKEQVNYRYAEDPDKSCEHCVHFSNNGACDLVSGPVRDVDTCDKFESKDGDDPDPGSRVDPTDKLRKPVPSEIVTESDVVRMLDTIIESSSSWGMSHEGGPGSGRRPEGKAMPITPGKRLGPAGVMKVSKKDIRDMTTHSRDAIRNKSMCGSKRTDIAGIVVGKPGSPDYADKVNKVNCPGCLGKIASRHFRASVEGGPGSGRRPSDAHSAIADSLGVKYDGIQKGAISRGGKRLTPDLALFTDPAHGSTLAIPAGLATPNWIAAKVAMVRKEFSRATQQKRQAHKDTVRHEAKESAAKAYWLAEAVLV